MAETTPARQWVVIEGGLAQDESADVDVLDLDDLGDRMQEPADWRRLYDLAKKHNIAWALEKISRLYPEGMYATQEELRAAYEADYAEGEERPVPSYEDYTQEMLDMGRIHPNFEPSLR